jgi:hypothetical protein
MILFKKKLYTRCTRPTASPSHEPKVSYPNLVRCSGIIPWYLPEIDATDLSQVAQTCYHSVTPGYWSLSPAITAPLPGPQIIIIHPPSFSCILNSTVLYQLPSKSLACVKNHPRVMDLFEYNLSTTYLTRRGSFSVALLTFGYIIISIKYLN